MSSKRKSPPTKLEGGCQPTTTTTTTTNAHTNSATLNQKNSNLHDKDTTLIKSHTDIEHFTKQDKDCDIDEEITADIDNNDHNNNDDDANDNCDTVTANTLTSDGFDGEWFASIYYWIMSVFHNFFI